MQSQLVRLFLIAGLSAITNSLLHATPPVVAGASVDPGNRRHVMVNFDNPAPPLAAVDQKTFWVIYQKTATATKRLEVERVEAGNLAVASAEKSIDLFLAEEVAGAPSIKELRILLANLTDLVPLNPLTSASELGTGTTNNAPVLAGAKNKSDADIYFNGSYTAVKDGDPVYDIDAFAGYMQAIQKGPAFYGKVGIYGQLRTRTSARADPNSFLTYLVYQNVIGSGGFWGPFQSPVFNYRFFGAEFDRTAKELNLINSPVLTIPFRPIPPPENESGKWTSWPQFNFLMGSEFVDVRKSVVAPTGRWHTRGLLGANFITGYAPKAKNFASWQISSSWQLRLPSAPEIFYDDRFAPVDPATGKKNSRKTPPMLGTQPRHSFDTKFTYNYAVWGGVTFEHTYGSMPPAFNKTDHSFAFGLTFTLQQTSVGRTSILRP